MGSDMNPDSSGTVRGSLSNCALRLLRKPIRQLAMAATPATDDHEKTGFHHATCVLGSPPFREGTNVNMLSWSS